MSIPSMIWYAVLLLALGSPWAQPEQLSGPSGTTVHSLFQHGSTLWAGTEFHGLFGSSDEGTTWEWIPGPRGDVYSVTAFGGSLFAGGQYGIYRSKDGGRIWNSIEKPFVLPCLALLPFGGHLFALGVDGVYRSEDTGTTWIRPGVSEQTGFQALAHCGNRLLLGTFRGLFQSTDTGATWNTVEAGGRALSDDMTGLLVSGNDVYAASNGGALFHSPDGGVTWSDIGGKLPSPPSLWKFGPIAVRGHHILVAIQNRIFRTGDRGLTWTPVHQGIPPAEIRTLAYAGSTLFAGTYRSGLYRSEDDGDTWTILHTGLSRAYVPAFASLGGVCFSGSANGGVFRSLDGGLTWTPSSSGLTDGQIGTFLVKDGILFTAPNRGIARSLDTGSSWSEIRTGIAEAKVLSMASLGGYLFAGAAGEVPGVYRSADKGTTWSHVSQGLGSLKGNALVTVGDTLFVGGNTGVYRSVDHGESWTPAREWSPSHGSPIISLAFFGGALYAGTDGKAVYRSTDRGATWSQFSMGLMFGTVPSLIVVGGDLLAGGEGVYRYSEAGMNWIKVVSGFGGVQALMAHGNHLLASTWDGIWRTPLSQAVTVDRRSARKVWSLAPKPAVRVGNGIRFFTGAGGGRLVDALGAKP